MSEHPNSMQLPLDLQAQIAALIRAIPKPRYSETVKAMLIEHGLITEPELAELRGDDLSTLQTYRSRGKMPRHYKWGSLICYHRDDIADLIMSEKIETNAAKRLRLSNSALLRGQA